MADSPFEVTECTSAPILLKHYYQYWTVIKEDKQCTYFSEEA